MPRIDSSLTFDKQTEEAARFCTSKYRNSANTRVSRSTDLGPQFSFSQGISIAVLCVAQEQVDEHGNRFVR